MACAGIENSNRLAPSVPPSSVYWTPVRGQQSPGEETSARVIQQRTWLVNLIGYKIDDDMDDNYISPHSADQICSGRKSTKNQIREIVPVIFTTNFGLLFAPVGTFSIFLTVNIPSITLPKTTCLLSKKSHFAVVIKN